MRHLCMFSKCPILSFGLHSLVGMQARCDRAETSVGKLTDQLQVANDKANERENLCNNLRHQMQSTSVHQAQHAKHTGQVADSLAAKSTGPGSPDCPPSSSPDEVEDMGYAVWPRPHRFQARHQHLWQQQKRLWGSASSSMQVVMKHGHGIATQGPQQSVAFDIFSQDAKISVEGLQVDGLRFDYTTR